jgi:uncharacterized SAM-binding protein YcdF (DUF218 family)
MFFIFSKLLFFLITPVTWIVVFMLIALLAKDPRRRKRFLILSLIAILFFTNTFLLDRFMNAWEVKAIPDSKLMNYDAAILLTGMSSIDIKLDRLEFNDRTDRLMQVLRLYKDQKIKKIILCGGPATISSSDSLEGDRLKSFLVKMGINPIDLILEDQSKNTHENAVYVKSILQDYYPNGKFLLVTSGWHMRRAVATFRREGIQITPYSTDRYGGPIKFDLDYLFLPSSATLFNWEKLFHEWVGCGVYWGKGWV